MALSLVGCGSSQPTGAATPPRSLDVMEMLFPSARYDADGREIARAQNALIRRCMAARGFTHPRTSSADYVGALEGTPAGIASLRARGVTVTYHTDGCLAQATARIRGDLRRYYAMVVSQNEARGIAGRHLAGDLALRRSLQAWRQCMAKRGLRYRSPGDARADARERGVATADRSCSDHTGLSPTLSQAQQRAAGSLPRPTRLAMLSLARARAQAVRRANAILAEP